jgi:pimeloyl-ACP methyl ester carboxylesterase
MRALKRWSIAVLVFFALFCLSLVGVGAFYRPNTAIPAGAPGRHVDVGGLPLRVVQEGAGRDVLLIHGSPGSIEDWEPVAKALSGDFRVTRFDRPGHGYSGDDGAYSLEHNAERALDLIKTLGLTYVVVAGHSYGGSTALAMALRHSPAVSAYVIVDSAAYQPRRRPDGGMRLLEVPLFGYGFGTVVAPLVSAKRIRSGIIEQFNGKAPPEDFIQQRIRIWSTPKVTHAIASESLGARDDLAGLSPGYPGIADPVTIIAEADSPFRKETAEHLHRDVPGSTLHLVPGTGHYVQFEKTAEVVDAIRAAAKQTEPRN